MLSHSNDTWLIEDGHHGAAVLRVCWRGDRARLLREAAVGAALPPAAGYPAVLGSGALPEQSLTWTLTRRLPGCSLGDAWPSLSGGQRKDAVRAVAQMLAALHSFRSSASLLALLLPPPLPVPTTVDAAVGRSLNPWPEGISVLLAEATRRGASAELAAEAGRLLDRDAPLGPSLDEAATTVVHSDLHLQNIWTDGGRVTGLLDLEWVRRAPAWVELANLTDEAQLDEIEGLTGHAELLDGLREHAPYLFAVDRLQQRLRLLQVAYQLRQLALWPLAEPSTAAPDHPLRRLAVLVGGPTSGL